MPSNYEFPIGVVIQPLLDNVFVEDQNFFSAPGNAQGIITETTGQLITSEAGAILITEGT